MEGIRAQEFVRAFPSVRALDGSDVKALLEATTTVRELENSLLFDEGDRPDAAYLVVDGRVRVERNLGSGRCIPLGRLGRGHIVGEMGLLSGLARSAAAVVEDDLVALRLDLDTYESFRTECHPGAIWLLAEIERRMSQRITSTYDRTVRLRGEPDLAEDIPTDTAVPARFYERVIRWMRRP